MREIPKQVWYFIAALTGFRLIYSYFLPLIPQEAYYWYYIQYPDWSYFDHPPMAAYSIGLGTWLFGDNFFGVKFMAVIWGALTNLFLYLTTIAAAEHFWPQSKERKTDLGMAALVLYNLTVFAHLYALVSVPDNPLLFFWILTLLFFLQILKTGQRRYRILLGIAGGLGLLSKYTFLALPPGFFVYLLYKKDQRHWLATVYPYLATLIMIAVFAPVIYWNWQHHWASFGFQFSQRASSLKPFQTKYILQLLASQLLILTPLGFVLVVRVFSRTIRKWRSDSGLVYFSLSGAFIIFGFLYISLRSLVKMNWLLPGYLGLLAAAAIVWFAQPAFLKKRWTRFGIAFSVFLIIVMHLIQIVPNLPLGEGNTWSGWRDAAQKVYRLQLQSGGRKASFIFANSYKSASLLKFYLPGHQNTYAQNIYGRPALQFDIWGVPDSLTGKNGWYVFDNRREYKSDLKYLRDYFDRVELVKKLEYTFLNRYPTRTIYIYFAENYHGRD